MKKILVVLAVLVSVTTQAQFEKYFFDKTLRVDYVHSGDHDNEVYALDEMLEEPYWGGSKVNLIDSMAYGNYFMKVFDLESDQLIYSRGYCTLFGEYQTTEESKSLWKSFEETVVMPYPQKEVRLELYSRNRKGEMIKKFEYTIDPESYFIKPERRLEYPVKDILVSGDPAQKVDIVILSEGYTAEQLKKFEKDCEAFAEYLFDFAPFSENKDQFNIRAVMAPSLDSGSDLPGKRKWKKTVMNSMFWTFDSERYCMTEDVKSVRDLAANTAYDQIYILINTSKYGGGGIYNHYNVSSIRNVASAKIIIHEFGHGFAGLADEYYDSSTSYNDFYPKGVEPWEPNITTLVNFDSKWKHLLDKDTKIPTAPSQWNEDVLGVYEGGGYSAKGVFRPKQDCLMHTFNGEVFCPACQEAIQKMINFYAK